MPLKSVVPLKSVLGFEKCLGYFGMFFGISFIFCLEGREGRNTKGALDVKRPFLILLAGRDAQGGWNKTPNAPQKENWYLVPIAKRLNFSFWNYFS